MKKDAEQLERSLQQAAQGAKIEGRMAPLVQTAHLVSSLAKVPPPPPNHLASGRRLFLSESARIRATKTTTKRTVWGPSRLRPVGVLLAAMLIFGLVFGLGQAAAATLPGEPLYGLKLTLEAIRMQWTTSRESRADLAAALAEERLDEIVRLVEQGQAVDESIAEGAKKQLALALQAVYQVEEQDRVQASQRLEDTLWVQEQAIVRATSTLSESLLEPVRDLQREINRVRQVLRSGSDQPGGERLHLRPSVSPDTQRAPDFTGQPGHKPVVPKHGEAGPGPGPQPDDRPAGPQPNEDHGSGPGPQSDDQPVGPQPDDRPAGPQPNEDHGSGSGPESDGQPAGPQPNQDPGTGPGPQSHDQPAGPQPNDDPGTGHGTQPEGQPAGPHPNDDPDTGPGTQPDGNSGSDPGVQSTEPPGGHESEPPNDPGTGGGSRNL